MKAGERESVRWYYPVHVLSVVSEPPKDFIMSSGVWLFYISLVTIPCFQRNLLRLHCSVRVLEFNEVRISKV